MAKELRFRGDSRVRLRAFPAAVRLAMGRELRRVQEGHEPNDSKPMPSVGPGVREVRVRDPSGAYRTMYVATLPEAVYVLHAFQKKTRKTATSDFDLAKTRLKALLRDELSMAKHGKRPARTDGRVSAPDEPGAPVFADIWEAIEPTPEAAAVARACSNLMDATIAKVESWHLTQREAAKRLGVTQPRLNQLLKGKITQFSLEALVELAMRAGLKVNIAVHDGRRAA